MILQFHQPIQLTHADFDDAMLAVAAGNEYVLGDKLFSMELVRDFRSMAAVAGIYEELWHPEEKGISSAQQLEPHLERAVEMMAREPKKFYKRISNGSRGFRTFVSDIRHLRVCCIMSPYAQLKVIR